MKTCPKCGFQNSRPQAEDCPKCGLIYSKFYKAQQSESKQMSAEKALNDSLTKVISNDQQRITSCADFEPIKDNDSYQMIGHLAFFLIAFSGVLAIWTIIEAKYFWGLLTQANETIRAFTNTDIFTKSDIWIMIVSVIFIGTLQVALCLAIGGFLHLGKDIADNTRATRNYLSQIFKGKR